MKALLVDIETQGLDTVNPFITEIGAKLYDVEGKVWGNIDGGARICFDHTYPPQPEVIVKLTGITDAMLKALGRPRQEVFAEFLLPLVNQADVIFAHNKAFDQVIIERTAEMLGIPFPKKEWICTKTEFPWREDLTCKKLQHLAYEHRIFWEWNIDPDSLHRAEDDVNLLSYLMREYDMKDILAFARSAQVFLVADCLAPWVDGGVQKDIASSAGFKWDAGMKAWTQKVKESQYGKVMDKVINSNSPFRVDIREQK